MAKIQCNVISYTLMRTVDIDVILPTVTIPESMINKGKIHHDYHKKFPVLYLLHGFGNNHAQWCGYTNVELYAEERQIAVVMISGENKKNIDQDEDLFADFIENELPEFITQVFPVSTRKEDTYIAGLSMGGFGALYHGLSHPEKYSAIGAFSPGIEMQGNPIDLYEVLDQCQHEIPIYMACGDKDFLYDTNVQFVKSLKEKKMSLTWLSVPGYEHEWRFWDKCIEEFLDWIQRSDAYANAKRKI